MNEKQRHTPGPWSIWKSNNRYVLNSAENGSFGAFIGFSSDGVTTENEDKANAKLIKSAPQLLKASKALVAHIDSLPEDTEKCRILKLALNNHAGDLLKEVIVSAEE